MHHRSVASCKAFVSSFLKNNVSEARASARALIRNHALPDGRASDTFWLLVRQVRFELTIPCLRGRCLDPIWLLTHGGTERTRTVIDLIDNQVPHLSATVPCEK